MSVALISLFPVPQALTKLKPQHNPFTYLIDIELYLLALLVIPGDDILDPPVVLPLLNERRLLVFIARVQPMLLG